MDDYYLPSCRNVYLRPKHSDLPHRADADVSVDFLGHKWACPVIPSNMLDVISFENAYWLAENDYFYIMHRFNNVNLPFVDRCLEDGMAYISISVGVEDTSKNELESILDKHGYDIIDFLTIDVAHADHENIREMMRYLNDLYDGYQNKPKIIAGNVATSEGYKFLCGLGVDAVKVGLGGGSICSTKSETGFHMPTFSSVLECVGNVPIIADGGVETHGDIAKLLVAGAKMVMCGGLFASCLDSPAAIVSGKKVYRGSTSYAAKGNDTHVEGKTLELDGEMTYATRMRKIKEALSSAISYAGGKDLSCFPTAGWHLVN